MTELHRILAGHRSKNRRSESSVVTKHTDVLVATSSEIPDIFFDQILVQFKLTRIEITVLMYLYRQVWSKPNLYKVYGISQLLSHTEMAKALNLGIDDIYHALRKMEEYSFISTVRSGQYFVRKYFTKENDELFGQTYDDFEI